MWDHEFNEEEPERHSAPWQLHSIVVYILMWQFCFGISDTGILALLLFLHGFFKFVLPGDIFDKFPKMLKSALKLAGIDTDLFTQYIVCPSCKTWIMDTLWKMTKKYQTAVHILLCLSIHLYPKNNPVTANENHNLQPHKIFVYHSIKDALKTLVSQKSFLENCEQWRSRQNNIPNRVLRDIYDGMVWKEFMNIDGDAFLESQYNFCFTLNGFSHTPTQVSG